jgi:hypothetical protein
LLRSGPSRGWSSAARAQPVYAAVPLRCARGAASANDMEIGELIAEVMEKVGKDGVITVEESKGLAFGVIVGLLNVTREDTERFLLAAIAFALSVTALNTVPVLGSQITNVLGYVAAFVAGAVIVVALKALFQTARS